MSIQQKFNAAVNVIKSLPKSGSYQPSNDLLLKFYSYYKQATEGKCTKSKPAFWDVINKAKWDAWKSLGDMSPENAMQAYVKELQNIVETMSYTDSVAAFFDTVDNDSSIPKDDLYLVAGDILKKTKSTPTTPINGSREPSITRNSTEHLHNGYADSEDEYTDTVEHVEPIVTVKKSSDTNRIPNGHAVQPLSSSYKSSSSESSLRNTEISNRVLEELQNTVNNLDRDLTQLKSRVEVMEKEQFSLKKSLLYARPSWWPLKTLSPAFLATLVLWPVIANRLYVAMMRKRRHLP